MTTLKTAFEEVPFNCISIVMFPELKIGQVTVVIADTFTGHILDHDLQLYLSDDQNVYAIFDDIVLAEEYVRNIMGKIDTVECVIYGHNENVLKFFRP